MDNPFTAPVMTPMTMAPTAVAAPAAATMDPRMAPPQAFLQHLLRLQQADPARFAQLLAAHRAQQFGITADNLGGMQSRQSLMPHFAPHPGMMQPGGIGGPVAPTGVMPTNPAAAQPLPSMAQLASVSGLGGGPQARPTNPFAMGSGLAQHPMYSS